jgi:PadR family transcriptional regulator, regulatory protein PadR
MSEAVKGTESAVKPTIALLRVLSVLLEDPTAKRYGLELCKAAGLRSGSVYPLLTRLEQQRWLTSDWEDADPREAKRPRRRFYQLTGVGEREGRAMLEEAQRILARGTPHPGLATPGGLPA